MSTPGIGDFGVVAIPGRVGKLIRLGQWLNGDGYADYEHAFVVVDSARVVEGRPSGAGYAPLAAYPKAMFYPCPDDHREAVAAAAVALIGTPYSWVDYVALAAVRFHLDLIARPLRDYVASSGHMICSQLVDEAYARGGVQLFDDGRLPGDVTPSDLYRLIAARHGVPVAAVRRVAHAVVDHPEG
jgi:cell wall-associated NlpC family hydrolase